MALAITMWQRQNPGTVLAQELLYLCSCRCQLIVLHSPVKTRTRCQGSGFVRETSLYTAPTTQIEPPPGPDLSTDAEMFSYSLRYGRRRDVRRQSVI